MHFLIGNAADPIECPREEGGESGQRQNRGRQRQQDSDDRKKQRGGFERIVEAIKGASDSAQSRAGGIKRQEKANQKEREAADREIKQPHSVHSLKKSRGTKRDRSQSKAGIERQSRFQSLRIPKEIQPRGGKKQEEEETTKSQSKEKSVMRVDASAQSNPRT